MLERLRADPTVDSLTTATHNYQACAVCTQRPMRTSSPNRVGGLTTRGGAARFRGLGPRGFGAVRLDRNKNIITTEEQARLNALTIGVAGLSVGHVIAHTLALAGLCGTLRLADFDELELSNLNRVHATVFDLGVNKAHVAARRIAELDPYLTVEVFDAGLSVETVDAFLDGLDIVVEECDSLDMKAVVRIGARDRRIPVLMATSDQGMVDVERFDEEPQRPIMHGLLGELDVGLLPGMSSREKSRTCCVTLKPNEYRRARLRL